MSDPTETPGEEFTPRPEVICESCTVTPATTEALVRRGQGQGYKVRICSGCLASYEQAFGDDLIIQ